MFFLHRHVEIYAINISLNLTGQYPDCIQPAPEERVGGGRGDVHLQGHHLYPELTQAHSSCWDKLII